MNSLDKQQYGDFQTPKSFVNKINYLLKSKYNINPEIIIEPTMGQGNFLLESINYYPELKKVIGIEINKEYIDNFKAQNSDLLKILELHTANIFDFNFGLIKSDLSKKDKILFIGNPPWVTSSDLSLLNSANLPLKTNFKSNKGIDAITGKSNFDLSEYILLYLMSEFRLITGTFFAFLCKDIVAKNIVRDLNKYNFYLEILDVYEFDAKEIFNVSTDAVLFVCKIGNKNSLFANVFSIDKPFEILRQFGWYNGKFNSNLLEYSKYRHLDGNCQLNWRQGIKHDAAKVMEFNLSENALINGYNDKLLFINSQYIYPLAKSSTLKEAQINKGFKYVLVTQKKVGEETDNIEHNDSEVWNYLNKYNYNFAKRKSVIYSKAPKYAIFGIGDYSFAKYKIAVSGFYKNLNFSLVYSDKPVMLDDTCYFLGFEKKEPAILVLCLLNNPLAKSFFKSISFMNSKRPYTKDVLQRIDLLKLYELISYSEIKKYIYEIEPHFDFTNHPISSIWKDLLLLFSAKN